ncbi:MAG: acyl-ACP--UDP-N-acetylglucosamine O-acyltransferase [Synergistaceae bacterium]|jgi:UDP-N-acetylglucosamine acyltransferase|nr:acyl-ACP--UDP-N-acetylglucosamine O-acyltransferase [Synergistaceae bacterium]
MSTAVHPTAVVSRSAELGDGVAVGPYCVVEAGAEIGAGTVLSAFVKVCGQTAIGKNCRIHENSVLGGDPQDHNYRGEPSMARVGDGCLIRENVTVNRATGEGCETVVGNSCFIMEGVHIAHNVRIGEGVTIANKVGLSGFVTVDDHTVFGGMAGVHQFVRIGSYCMIGGMYRVTKDVPHYTLASGDPLRLVGLNSVGLRRAGFTPSVRRKILSFYRELYGSGLFSRALENAVKKRDSYCPEVQRILDFYGLSKRGVTFWSRAKEAREAKEKDSTED